MRDWRIAFELTGDDAATARIFHRLKLDQNNPLHWRALLEAFVRAYEATTGRPRKWTEESEVKLGLDVYELVSIKRAKKPTISEACKLLRTDPTYKKVYSGVKVDRLRKLVGKLTGRGPLDGARLLTNLKNLYPEHFYDAFMSRGTKKASKTPR